VIVSAQRLVRQLPYVVEEPRPRRDPLAAGYHGRGRDLYRHTREGVNRFVGVRRSPHDRETWPHGDRYGLLGWPALYERPDASQVFRDFSLTSNPLRIHLPGAVVQPKASGVAGRSWPFLAVDVWRHSHHAAAEEILQRLADKSHSMGEQKR
jgi:hypothetical protein